MNRQPVQQVPTNASGKKQVGAFAGQAYIPPYGGVDPFPGQGPFDPYGPGPFPPYPPMALRGPPGPPGERGEQGEQGPAGRVENVGKQCSINSYTITNSKKRVCSLDVPKNGVYQVSFTGIISTPNDATTASTVVAYASQGPLDVIAGSKLIQNDFHVLNSSYTASLVQGQISFSLEAIGGTLSLDSGYASIQLLAHNHHNHITVNNA